MFNAARLLETSHYDVALINLTAHQIVLFCISFDVSYHYITFGVFEKGFKLRNSGRRG